MYLSEHFQLGTLAQGTCEPDINGFKILVADQQQGAAQIVAAPCSDPRLLASPQYRKGILAGPSAVGQNGNLALYLTAEAPQPYLWIVPASARLEPGKKSLIVHTERCSIAIWPVNATQPVVDEALTSELRSKKPENAINVVLRSDRVGSGLYGFAVELSERLEPREFARRAAEVEVDMSALTDATAAIRGAEARELKVQWAPEVGAVGIWRDGVKRDWSGPDENRAFGTFGDEAEAPLLQDWRGGRLRVRAGGYEFQSTVAPDGRAEFTTTIK
jgi:hypothetical protein